MTHYKFTSYQELENRKLNRRRHPVTKEELDSVLSMKQTEAARKLSVSVSTLKKHYKRWYPGKKWYDNSGRRRTRTRTKKMTVDPRMKLSYILNDPQDCPSYGYVCYFDHPGVNAGQGKSFVQPLKKSSPNGQRNQYYNDWNQY